MTQQQPKPDNDDRAARKRAARTALWLAAVAVAVYAGFLLLGVLGQ